MAAPRSSLSAWALASAEAGLQLISGPTEFDPTAGNFVTADYITTSFADLASNLEDFALRLCESSVTVTKEASTLAAPTTYAAAPGWTFSATNDTAPPAVTPASDQTDDSGQIEFTWSSPVSETVTITETQMASFQLTSRTCTLGGEAFPFTETANGVQLTLTQGQHVSCTFRNQPAFIDLSVAKTDGKTTTEPGATNSYVITATNAPDATATATDVILTETVPANTTYEATGSAAWSCADESVAGTVCTINVGSLAPGASANRTFNVEVINPVGAEVSSITNTVTVTGTGNERDTGDQTATDVDTLTAAPDLTVVKDDGGVTADARRTSHLRHRVRQRRRRRRHQRGAHRDGAGPSPPSWPGGLDLRGHAPAVRGRRPGLPAPAVRSTSP